MKQMQIFLIAGIFLLLGSNVQAAGSWGEIVRNPDGSVRIMDWQAATQYCTQVHQRLPSAREYAELSISLGAKGIRESAYKGVDYGENEAVFKALKEETKNNQREGYSLSVIKATSVNETKNSLELDFYFCSAGYQRPAGDLGLFGFWSSTKGYDSYIFNGLTGGIETDYELRWNAVRCIRD